MLKEAMKLANHQNNQLALVDAWRVQGMLQTRKAKASGTDEQWKEAERSFQEAVTLAHKMGDPYAGARALYEQAIMHVEKQDREEAQKLLKRALKTFQQLGAHPYVNRTEQKLGELSP